MKNLWCARAVLASLLFLLMSLINSTAGQKQLSGVSVMKIFETTDEVVLRVSVESLEPTHYAIRTKDGSGDGTVGGTTSAVANSKRYEATAWVVVSRIKPNVGEDRVFEKIIVQSGLTTAEGLGTQVRTLPKQPRAIVINERKQSRKLDVKPNEEIEILRSEDLRLLVIVGDQPSENTRTIKE